MKHDGRVSVALRNPDECPCGHAPSLIVNSRRRFGHVIRRHLCPKCGQRWNGWETIIDPKRLTLKHHKAHHI